ncbi:MAG: cation-transporting P-type ATPase [ANME-2 cluster archaeon]|nr:cation-transporting P-type ATPase [ANME-2 cluster archaeon]
MNSTIRSDTDITAILEQLQSHTSGLTEEEAIRRLTRYGRNELKKNIIAMPLKIVARQFLDFMLLLLIIAAIVSFLIGETLDGLVITGFVVFNAILGFTQEYRAERALESLKSMIAPQARVIRDDSERMVDAAELVPGDVILLIAGDKVQADVIVIDGELQMDESVLTGESHIVNRSSTHTVHAGTTVTHGRGTCVVTNTGMNTAFGRIAAMVQIEKRKTPLQRRLAQLARYLGTGALVICVIVFITGIMNGIPADKMFIATVSLAVAAVPEGLPAVVTIALALGVQNMVKKNAIIRKLQAVETLGCATVICTDKTGTLTQNEMTVRKIYTDGTLIDVTGEGYAPFGEFRSEKEFHEKSVRFFLQIGTLCNDASLTQPEEGNWKILGDPTEGALVVAAAKADINKQELAEKYPRVAEIPFDPERKYMTTIHEVHDAVKILDLAYVICVKGALDSILEKCSHIYRDGEVVPLTVTDADAIQHVHQDMTVHALRVLALAYKPLDDITEQHQHDLIFAGMVGMIDPPRSGVKEAIATCKKAGITTIMITGDHRDTAKAIAIELGIIDPEHTGKIVTGDDMDAGIGQKALVYARTSPTHKVQIISALQSQGDIVAMTGDGVNDAPALKMADIGIAMGITGTDVAKEVSDMVLTDDNFVSIAHAVELGRGIYDNIKKFLRFQLSTNVGAILLIFFGLLIGLPLPLAPQQILFINLLMDGPPALSLSMEPYHKTMNRPPRDPDEPIITKDVMKFITGTSMVMFIGTILVFLYALQEYPEDIDHARTLAFTTFVLFQLFNAFNCRSDQYPLTRIGVFSNRYLIGAVGLSALLQMCVLYTSPLQLIFDTVPLGVHDWVIVLSVSAMVFVIVEGMKVIRNRRFV